MGAQQPNCYFKRSAMVRSLALAVVLQLVSDKNNVNRGRSVPHHEFVQLRAP